MKKRLLFGFIVVALGVLLSVILCACTETKNAQSKLSEECLRIHIRANSNSEEDQAVKLKVRDELTAYFTECLKTCSTKEEAYCALENNMEKIYEIAKTTLKVNNFDYKVSVKLTNEYFPDRKYDGYDFPEGEYDALIVGLGEAKGDNWWCVAFPPLCFVPNGEGEKVVYKSWVKEMLEKLFS